MVSTLARLIRPNVAGAIPFHSLQCSWNRLGGYELSGMQLVLPLLGQMQEGAAQALSLCYVLYLFTQLPTWPANALGNGAP